MSHRDKYNESGPHLSEAKEDKKSELSPIEAPLDQDYRKNFDK